MLDVIVVGLVVAAVQFDAVMGAEAGQGIVYFAASVALTMLAAQCFDGRAVWDAPREAGRSEPSPGAAEARATA
jgi:paraquat-inducible protein A